MPDEDGITIRSFRLAFDFERRIFKVDRWRLPFAYGLALRTIAYGAIALAGVVALMDVPVAGAVLDAMPAPIRFVVVPIAAAYALTNVNVDGRTAHRAAAAWVRHATTPGRVVGCCRPTATGRVVLAQMAVAPDERSPRYRRGAVGGPAVLTLRYPATARVRGSTLIVEPRPGRPLRRAKRVRLARRQRVVFR